MNDNIDNNWIIGCGSIGQRIGHRLITDGQCVNTLTHSHERIPTLNSEGFNGTFGDLDNPDTLVNLDFSHAKIFYLAPPPSEGEVDSRIQNFIAALKTRSAPKKIVYISTTGVYGNSNGNWINESTPLEPANARSMRRLDAETALQDYTSEHGTLLAILRVVGIYCSDKLPLKRIDSGLKILKTSIAPSSNRIHGDDLANISIRAMQLNHSTILNVADGNPSSISDYFIKTAKVFNLTPPTEIDWDEANKTLSPGMLSYLRESKKIDPTLMLNTLNYQLMYPTLDDGLKECFDSLKHSQKNLL